MILNSISKRSIRILASLAFWFAFSLSAVGLPVIGVSDDEQAGNEQVESKQREVAEIGVFPARRRSRFLPIHFLHGAGSSTSLWIPSRRNSGLAFPP